MKLWAKTVTYWSAVFAVMVADNDLGWDDVAIGLVAIPLYFRFVFKRN